MKKLYFLSLIILLSCNNRQQPVYDIPMRLRPGYVGPKELSPAEKQEFLSRNLKLSKPLYVKQQCNFMQAHMLVKKFSSNKDSLTLAVKILTDSFWASIPYSTECVKNVRCGVYLYEKEKDFEMEGARLWFAMGTKISGEEAHVNTMDWSPYVKLKRHGKKNK